MVGSYLTLFTILVIQVQQAASQDCGDASWTLSSNTCFNLIEWSDMGWPEARQSCVARGGDLASLSTPSIQTAAEEFLRADGKGGENVWIGLYFPDLNGPPNGRPTQERRLGWVWTDNSPYTNPSWERWEPNEPGGGEPYVRLRGSEWIAIGKGGKFRYALCQKTPDTQAPPPTPQPTPAPTSSTIMSTVTTGETTTTTTTTRLGPTSTLTTTLSPSSSTTKETTLSLKPWLSPAGGQADCGDIQWQYIEQNRACYNIQSLSSSIDWERAEAACRDMNGHLATPSTADQHDAVISMIRDARLDKTDLWIGLQHQNGASGDLREGWQWLDGSPYTFTNWQQNEPGAGERFARLKAGMWWAISRGSFTDFLCQKDPVFISPPSSAEPSTQTTEQSTSHVFAKPTFAPATPKPPGGSDQNNVVKDPLGVNGDQDGENGVEGGRSITLLAIIVLILPVALIAILVVLYKRGLLNSCNVWHKVGKHDQNTVHDQNPDSQNIRTDHGSTDYTHLENPFLSAANDSFYTSIENNEYEYIDINAIYSAGNTFGFIPTRAPTVANGAHFWQTAWDNRCDTIVMLCTPNQLGNELYYPYKEGASCNMTPFLIECNKIKPEKHTSCRYLNVTLPDKEIRQFLHINVLSGDFDTKPSEELLEIFLEIYRQVNEKKLKYKKNTLVMVHCLDGTEWTGLFCAFSCFVDQVDFRKEVDISQVLDLLKPSQNSFISSKKQHVKLVEMIFHLIKSQEQYSKIFEGKGV